MFICFYCGDSLEDSQRSEEHIIPESCGGNITTWKVCKTCNNRANKEIDEKFKNEWFVSWERAFLGLPDKRGRKHTERIETTKEDGEKIQLLVCEEGIVPIAKPDINWENDKITLKVDPRYVTNILKDVEKKAIKQGMNFIAPDELPTPISEQVGKVGISKKIDVPVIRREQVKIILGLACFFIPNFTNSTTANLLRNYLWDPNGKDAIVNLQSKLYPFDVTKDTLPSYIQQGNTVYTTPNEGMEIEVLIQTLGIENEHIFAVYRHKGKLRLFLSIFGKINAVIDTCESPDHFYLGPVLYKDTAYIVHPKEKKHKKMNIEEILTLVPSLASSKLAGALSSRPDLLNS
ncbi:MULTISPECIES: HNH endonuclease [Peribacillus]|uniref:HNH endonuclease n=1 Tax=Peribacillus TaxID=2675229 RepID=UPI0010712400|nr:MULTISPECIES: HNH endonuclease [Peribacillus]MDV7763997.1 HNH endonuclease [Peribacillus sp. CSMR9]TFH61197.1 HNH endonuclease [Peribacillus frigoritolerans]